MELLDERMPEPRRTLFFRWRTANNVPDLL
jgi:hypothetical protein